MDILTANIRRSSGMKQEDDSVLIIHSDAPVARQVILEFFKLVPRTLQVIEADRGVEHIQFANHDLPNSLINPSRRFRISTVINVLRGLISERLDHLSMVHVYRVHVKDTRVPCPFERERWTLTH